MRGMAMNCMKCGREIGEGQVFCDTCLDMMRKYPVKPGIAIQLPIRNHTPAPKKTYSRRRQPLTPEEQLLRLKKRVKRITVLWLVTLALLAATIYPAVEYFLGKSFLLPGQNYTTITDADTTQP